MTDPMLEKMPTGIRGLDHLLRGGILRGSSFLVEGPPGSGKTTFAVRMIYEGIVQYKEPGLIITFEEFPKQIYQESLSYGLDLEALEQSGMLRVVWTSPSRILEGFTGKNDLVDKIVGDLKVRRLAIDSVTHFKRVAASEVELREALAKILSYLKIKGISSILLKEIDRMDEESIAFEEYLVDASMRVYSLASASGGEDQRVCELRKTRGQEHVSGRHPFTLGPTGVTIYPHLRAEDAREPFLDWPPPPRERLPFGVEGLDEMLGGGLWRGSTNLVTGYPGTGKSALAYHFLDRGLAAREGALIVALKSTPAEIILEAASLGMDWRAAADGGSLRILDFPSSGVALEQVSNEILAELVERRPARLALDSVEDLRAFARGPEPTRDFLHVLAEMLRAAGVTSLLLGESALRSGDSSGKALGWNYLANTVMQLSLNVAAGESRRFVAIAKHVGSPHAKDVREFTIDAGGIKIGPRAAMPPR